MAVFNLTKWICISFVLVILSCGKDNDPKNLLEGCCGNPAIEESFGDAHIYIPNIFTPNGDGINDLFAIYGDSIRIIHLFEISNANQEVVFAKQNFLPGNFDSLWDGTIDGEVQKGVYTFTITLQSEDGVLKVIDGKICNYPCGDLTIDELISDQNCKFPAQVDSHGYYCPTCPSAENFDCFE